MPRVVVRPRADHDLFEIASYIARDDPAAADHLIDTIEDKFRLLGTSPKLGRARNELARRLRSFPFGSYVIFYRPIKGGIEVVRVLHGMRDLPRAFRGP